MEVSIYGTVGYFFSLGVVTSWLVIMFKFFSTAKMSAMLNKFGRAFSGPRDFSLKTWFILFLSVHMLNSLNPLKKSLPFWEELILAFWCVELINWEELESAINTKNINSETHVNGKAFQNSCIYCQYSQFYSWFTADSFLIITEIETNPPMPEP